MRIQAVLLAGDRAHSKAVRGRSKSFIEIDGRPMLVHVLEALLRTPEVSEVFVVGNAPRLEKAIAEHGCLRLAAARSRGIHVVPQHETLFDNIWNAFLRTLPPEGPVEDHPILIVPADIPLVLPEEISDFVRQAVALEVDYVIGLSPDTALARFAPTEANPGVHMASFNVAEGRLRQNNLHYVRPLRMGNRHYIQDMYENRYQKQFGSAFLLAWRVLLKEFRHLWVIGFYLLMHLAGVLERRGFVRASDRVRARVSLATVERGIGKLLDTRVRTTVTILGGAAVDIDNALDLAAAEKMIGPWKAMQLRTARTAAARR